MARKERSGQKSIFQKAMEQLYPSCIRVRNSTPGKHDVPAERQRSSVVDGCNNTSARRTAHYLCMDLLYTAQGHQSCGAGSVHSAPCLAVQHRRASHCSKSPYMSTELTANTNLKLLKMA